MRDTDEEVPRARSGRVLSVGVLSLSTRAHRLPP